MLLPTCSEQISLFIETLLPYRISSCGKAEGWQTEAETVPSPIFCVVVPLLLKWAFIQIPKIHQIISEEHAAIDPGLRPRVPEDSAQCPSARP